MISFNQLGWIVKEVSRLVVKNILKELKNHEIIQSQSFQTQSLTESFGYFCEDLKSQLYNIQIEQSNLLKSFQVIQQSPTRISQNSQMEQPQQRISSQLKNPLSSQRLLDPELGEIERKILLESSILVDKSNFQFNNPIKKFALDDSMNEYIDELKPRNRQINRQVAESRNKQNNLQGDDIVCMVRRSAGYCYHYEWCDHVRNRNHIVKITENEAMQMGCRGCKVCNR